jgi:hypothetical protein
MNQKNKQKFAEIGKQLKPIKWTSKQAKEHSDKMKKFLEGE